MIEVHAYVEVADLDAAVRFYTEGLGLEVRRRLTARWVELAGASLPVHLLHRPEPAFAAGEATVKRDHRRHWTPVHLDFVVENLETAVARALAAGGTVDRAIVDHRHWRFANLADPSGNGVDVIELSGGGYETFLAERDHGGPR